MRPLRVSAPTVLAGSVLLGLLAPPVAELLRPLLFPSLFFLMLLSMLDIDLPSELRTLRDRHRRLVGIAGWQMLILPAGLGLVHRYTPLGGEVTALAFHTACAGTVFGAPAFAALLGVDRGVVLRGVLASTLLMPITLPPLALAFGSGGGFDLVGYLWRLALFLLLPMAIGWVYRGAGLARRFGSGALVRRGQVLFLAVFAVAVMDGVGPRFVAEPAAMLGLLGTAFAVHLGLLGATWLAFRRFGRELAAGAALLAAYRNLGLLLAVAEPMLPTGFIVFVALWQVPMYAMPLLASRWLRSG